MIKLDYSHARDSVEAASERASERTFISVATRLFHPELTPVVRIFSLAVRVNGEGGEGLDFSRPCLPSLSLQVDSCDYHGVRQSMTKVFLFVTAFRQQIEKAAKVEKKNRGLDSLLRSRRTHASLEKPSYITVY